MPTLVAPSAVAAPPRPAGWTCPFCALLCEGLDVQPAAEPRLGGSTCPRALAALRALPPCAPDAVGARVDGRPVPLDEAVAAAAGRLGRWRQPLVGGLGTDIAGMRALYRLAARVGAITEHADGATLMQGVRALQDRGQYTATLGEVRVRADLIVCLGTEAEARQPELFRRFGLGEAGSPCRGLVYVGAPNGRDVPGVATEHVAGTGHLMDDVQQLAALVDGHPLPGADAGLRSLASRLQAATYAVLVWEGATLPPEGALVVERINRIVGLLNRRTRAASFGLGGHDGAFSANQTVTWLSGLPLRTRVARDGLQHEPRAYDGARLLAGAAVDGLLWVSSFDPGRVPPGGLPRIVLGPPSMGDALAGADDIVFIAVATPGLTADGHLFRIDGPVVLAVHAARDDGLPGVADVARRLEAALPPEPRA